MSNRQVEMPAKAGFSYRAVTKAVYVQRCCTYPRREVPSAQKSRPGSAPGRLSVRRPTGLSALPTGQPGQVGGNHARPIRHLVLVALTGLRRLVT